MSKIQIDEVDVSALDRYASISIAFQIRSIYRVELINDGLGGMQFMEEPVVPYIKDYDMTLDGNPLRWPTHFDIRNWGFFLASHGPQLIGAATLAFNTSGVNMLEGRSDLSVLWDIRIQSEFRRQGVGRQLYKEALAWSRSKGCRQMKIETQNINVPACKFYQQMGCRLGEIHRFAYTTESDCASEVMLNWYMDIQ